MYIVLAAAAASEFKLFICSSFQHNTTSWRKLNVAFKVCNRMLRKIARLKKDVYAKIVLVSLSYYFPYVKQARNLYLQIFNRKSISRNTTHRRSLNLQAMLKC